MAAGSAGDADVGGSARQGNPKNAAPFRDRVLTLAAPFTGQPAEFAKTEWRYAGLTFTDKGIGLLVEGDRTSRRQRTWVLDDLAAPRKVWDRKADDSYSNPGTPVTPADGRCGHPERRRHLPLRRRVVAAGRSPLPRSPEHEDARQRADLPVGRQELRNDRRAARRRGEDGPDAVRDAERSAELLRPRHRRGHEARDHGVQGSRAAAARRAAAVRHLQAQGRRRASTARCICRPTTRQGTRVPVVMWAYPREFGDADSAGQVTGSPNRFTTYAARRTSSC